MTHRRRDNLLQHQTPVGRTSGQRTTLQRQVHGTVSVINEPKLTTRRPHPHLPRHNPPRAIHSLMVSQSHQRQHPANLHLLPQSRSSGPGSKANWNPVAKYWTKKLLTPFLRRSVTLVRTKRRNRSPGGAEMMMFHCLELLTNWRDNISTMCILTSEYAILWSL